MEGKVRRTAIDVVGDVPWGTHFCQFYQTKEDLIDILVPYFRAGLKDNEFCMWVTSEPLNVEDAKKALKKKVKGLDDYIKKGQIEILDYSQWYTKSGHFDADEVLQSWVEKERQALKKGFEGLRLTGNTFWLVERDWEDFTDYEAAVNSVIGQHRMLAVCTYCLDKCTASEIIDVVNNHQFALIKRKSKWEIIESAEHKKTTEALRESRDYLERLTNSMWDVVFSVKMPERVIEWVNDSFRLTGYDPEDCIGRTTEFLYPNKREFIDFGNKLQKAIKAGEDVLQAEQILGRKNGETFPAEITTTIFREKGEIRRVTSIVRDITERKRAQKALEESEDKYRAIFAQAADSIVLSDAETGELVEFNDRAYENLGYTREEFQRLKIPDFEVIESSEQVAKHIVKIVGQGADAFKTKRRTKSGEIRDILVSSKAVSIGGKNFILSTWRDITDRKNMEAQQLFAGKILERINQKGECLDIIHDVLRLVKQSTGFEAVGIRLREAGDFPYFAVKGFSDEFVEAENYLCARDENGEHIYDSQGNTVLECMCGNVLSGRTDPALPFFTEGGSFWTNSTTMLLASTSEQERQGRTRNRCNKAGYESVALIPLRSSEEIVGLLQLNDTQWGRFTPEMIGFFEGIGASIGIALARIRAEEEAKNLAKFPSEDPNPVLRITKDGILLYANAASKSLLAEWDCEVGQIVPENWRQMVSEAFASKSGKRIEIEHTQRTFSFVFAPVPEADYVNLYGRDITERKQAEEQIENLAKFPSENPYPVLRIAKEGMVLYANAAGSELLKNWGRKVGERAPEDWHQHILEILKSGLSQDIEVVCKDRVFSLIMAPVVDAKYVNIYGTDITERKRAEEDLRKYRQHLEELVEERTGELTEANKQLLEQIGRGKQLERAILDISEREQRRIGRELHDSIGQQFTGIAFMTKVLEQKLATKLPEEAASVEEIGKLVNQAMNQTRGLVRVLEPVTLDAGSLMLALQEFSATTEHLFGIRCTFKCDKAVPIDDATVEVHLYRMTQEAVTNAIKHGQAKNIHIELLYGKDKSLLRVESDGIDFPGMQVKGKGMGLQIMDHRAEMIGGSLDIRKGDKGGTIATCIFPTKNVNNNSEKVYGSKEDAG